MTTTPTIPIGMSESPANPDMKHGGGSRVRVQFKEEDIARLQNKARRKPQPKARPPHPAKVKVSKEDFIQQLKVVSFLTVAFVFWLFYTSQTNPMVTNKIKGGRAKSAGATDLLATMKEDKLQLVEPSIRDNLQIQIPQWEEDGDGDIDDNDNDEQTDNLGATACSIYLADTSIPGSRSGLGIFTTKSFEMGQVVIPSTDLIDIGNGILLPLYLAFMKQHEIYGNVKTHNVDGSSIVSSRDIKAGEELFINFHDFVDEAQRKEFETIYHTKLHIHDPTADEYERADTIIQEVFATIPYKIEYEKPKVKNYKRSRNDRRGMKAHKIPSYDAGAMLSIFKNQFQDFNTNIAELIPATTVEGRSILEMGGTSRFISNDRTVDWVVRNGICLDGLHHTNHESEEEGGGAFATRNVSRGDVILTTPLYAFDKEESPDVDITCFNNAIEGISLCPLSSASALKKGVTCSGNDGKEKDCPRNMVNAKAQWSEYNMLNKDIDGITTESLLKNPLSGLTIDIVATRDIAKDEEVFLDLQIES